MVAYSPTVLPAMRSIATGPCSIAVSLIPDGREPVPTTSVFAVTRWGRLGMGGCKQRSKQQPDQHRAERSAAEAELLGTWVRQYHNNHQKDEPAPPPAHADVIM